MKTKTAIAGLSIFVLLGMTSMGTLGEDPVEVIGVFSGTPELTGTESLPGVALTWTWGWDNHEPSNLQHDRADFGISDDCMPVKVAGDCEVWASGVFGRADCTYQGNGEWIGWIEIYPPHNKAFSCGFADWGSDFSVVDPPCDLWLHIDTNVGNPAISGKGTGIIPCGILS